MSVFTRLWSEAEFLAEAQRVLEKAAAEHGLKVWRLPFDKWALQRTAFPSTSNQLPVEIVDSVIVGSADAEPTVETACMTVSASLDQYVVATRYEDELSDSFATMSGKLVGIRPMQSVRLMWM